MHYNPIVSFLTGSFLTAFLLSSCQEDSSPSEVINGKVPVSLSIFSQSGGLVSKDAFKSVHILVFKGTLTTLGESPLDYTVEATRKQDDTFVGSFIPSQHAQDLYRLVVLANVDSTKVAALSQGMTYDRISETLYEDAGQRYSTEDPVPMFGVVKKGEPMSIKQHMVLGTINLIRAVVRVDIGVGTYKDGKWELPATDNYFELTDVQAWSPMRRIFTVPKSENFTCDTGTPLVSKATGDLKFSATTAVKWEYADGDILSNGQATYCQDVIYLPEAPLNGYTANQPENRDQRTTLIIGGLLHDPAAPVDSKLKTWYRVDFTTASGSTPDRDLIDILRNHLYRISLNVRGRGAATPKEAWNVPPTEIGLTMETVAWEAGGTVHTPIRPEYPID